MLSITVKTTTPSSKHLVCTSGWFLIYLASIDAILQDHSDNVVNRARLSLLLRISGRGKQPVRVRNARRRAVRGVSAQPHNNCHTSSLNVLRSSDTANLNAPGIIPLVNLSAQDPGTGQDGSTSILGIFPGDGRETGISALCLFRHF